MSTNHHTPIAGGAAVNISSVNTPMGQLDSAVSGLQSGALAHTGMRFTATFTDVTLTIADTITITSITHNVKARTGVQDFLVDILGGVDGQIVILKAYSGHSILIRNSGSIDVSNQFYLSGNQVLILHLQGSTWREFGYNNRVKFFNENTALDDGADELVVPYNSYYNYTSGNARRVRLDMTPALSARAHFDIRCASGATYPSLIAAPTSTGTVAAANDSTDTFNSHTSGAVAGNTAGLVSSTFNVWRVDYRPIFACRIMTGPLITAQRIYIGLAGATPPNSDTLATSFVGVRYSTVAGDTGFTPVACDGATQTLGTSFGTLFADTLYDLRIYYTSTSTVVALRVGSASASWTEQAISGGPFSGVDIGWAALLIVTSASARVLKLCRIYGEYGGF
jgi:hypothetical protein